jgi:squalene-associated FAD-dependent desaturase
MANDLKNPFSKNAFKETKVSEGCPHSTRTVTVVGGGVAGLSAACALADAGFQVTVMERRGYLGGRASSYLHPGTGEVIDNCQHVLFGCCTNLVNLYQRIGVENKIFWDNRMTLIEPGGRRSVLAPSILPAPMHGLPAILRSRCFTFKDKLSLLFAFASVLFAGIVGSKSQPDRSLDDWLKTHLQSRGALERFWRLVIASALNADLDQIGLPYAEKVIRELFLNSAGAGSMGMSTVPLSELYQGAQGYLEARGGSIRFHCNVESANWNHEKKLWTIQTQGGEFISEMMVLALPFEATAKLLPNLPATPDAAHLAVSLGELEHWPICSVHLWFDREITELDHAVLLDRDIHWMYHKSRWQPQRNSNVSYIELVVSASREFAALNREQAIARAMDQLAEFFPAVKQAKLLKSALTKEMRATFGVPPGVDSSRPGAISPWINCFLAGDWIATGWPSTMESAARSGYLAAEALCASLGDRKEFLVPDLAPRGLMRLFR